MTSIEMRGVTKAFGRGPTKVLAVDDLSLSIRSGEFITFVGPSGCGKTTTLRMLAGLETPSSGEVVFGDRNVTDVPTQKRDIGMVFQNYAIFPHMTVEKNIGYGLKVRRTERRKRTLLVRDAAKMLGVGELLYRYPRQLSGGQKQRVALARALVREPGIIFLDEPLSNLDAKLRDDMRTQLKLLHERIGATMVYVTHDQLEAQTLSDRLAVMRGGIIEQIGPPEQVFTRPQSPFVGEFIGSPRMNLMAATIEVRDGKRPIAVLNDGTGVELSSDFCSEPQISGRGATVGIRPQHVHVGGPTGGEDGWTAEVVEPVGTEATVHFIRGDSKITAVVNSDRRIERGERYKLTLPSERLNVFRTEGQDGVGETAGTGLSSG